jgi:hypothetical protein
MIPAACKATGIIAAAHAAAQYEQKMQNII